MKRSILFLQTVFCVLSFNACSDKTEADVHQLEVQHEDAGDHAMKNSTSLTREQMNSIGIELGTIEQKELTNSIKASGILTVPNQNKAYVTPLFGGVIRSLNVQPGTYVKQGQPIATIVNPDLLQMQQQLHQLNEQIKLSEIEEARQKELVEGNAAPLKRLQQVQTELETLRSQHSGLQKQLSAVGASQQFSSLIVVKAPISGAISKVMTQLGSHVDVSTPIAEIVNNSQLHLDLFVYEKDLPKLKVDQVIHFTITNDAGKEYDAQIFSIGTAFEEGTRTIPVHAKVIGDKTGLIDGMNVTALVSLNRQTLPAVPTGAIVNYQEKDYIFRVAATDQPDINKGKNTGTSQDNKNESIHFEMIPVVKGTTDIGYSQITLLKTIPEQSTIVTKGAFFILAKITNVGEDDH